MMSTENAISLLPEEITRISLESKLNPDCEEYHPPPRKDTSCSEVSTTSSEDYGSHIRGNLIRSESILPSSEDDSGKDNEESDGANEDAYYDARDTLKIITNHQASLAARRDSGIEADRRDNSSAAEDAPSGNDNDVHQDQEPPMVIPNQEMIDKIVEQVEYYFSDESIIKDAFLLKHVRRNKEGFVSLKLITCFKRVKHITKDWRQVAYAAKYSAKLEVNEPGTKVRRKEPLPEFDETTPSRTVLAYNLPLEKPSIGNVSSLFSECGDIALVRVLRPNNPMPGDLKQFLSKNPHISATCCALVEFDSSEAARKAVQEMNNATDLEKLQVIMMTTKSAKKKTKENKEANNGNNRRKMSGTDSEWEEERHRRIYTNVRRKSSRLEILRRGSDTSSTCLSSSDESNCYSRCSGLNTCCSPNYSRRNFSPRHSTTTFDFTTAFHRPIEKSKSATNNATNQLLAPQNYYECHRRQSADFSQLHHRNQIVGMNMNLNNMGLNMNGGQGPAFNFYPPMHHHPYSEFCLRQPRGPDGGRGFGANGFGTSSQQRGMVSNGACVAPPSGVNWRSPSAIIGPNDKPRSGSVPTVIYNPANNAAE